MAIQKWSEHLQFVKHRMFSKKTVNHNDMRTELNRCLSTAQLTFLGVGSTVGVGIYVLLGQIAKECAGPASMFSFLAAVLLTVINAFVFTEFSSYIPQIGATYSFLYVVYGEFPAFLCGWITQLISMFSGAIGARAWSGMVDTFFNNTVQEHIDSSLGKVQFGPPFSESLDLVAGVFQVIIILIVSMNVQCSSVINTILGVLICSALVMVFVVGLIYGDVKNFLNADHGGFFPFGFSGIVQGASLALYATVGFEVIPISAEEAKDPKKSVPRAIILEFFIVTLVYIGALVGMLFLIPYWLLDLRAPLPSAFGYQDLIWEKHVITIAPLLGITNLQVLGLYGASRVMYRMAADGLLFKMFLKVNKQTGVPVTCVVFLGVTNALASLCFDLSYIVRIMVVLGLLNYISVGSALIKLKITEDNKVKQNIQRTVKREKDFIEHEIIVEEEEEEKEELILDAREKNNLNWNQGSCSMEMNDIAVSGEDKTIKEIPSSNNSERGGPIKLSLFDDQTTETICREVNGHELEAFSHTISDERELIPVSETSTASGPDPSISWRKKMSKKLSPFIPGIISINQLIFLHFICCIMLAVQLNFGQKDLAAGQPVAIFSLCLLVFLLFLLSFFLWLQFNPGREPGFTTPLMPLVPTLSIVSSTVLLFSAVDKFEVIEVSIFTLLGCMVYIVMALVRSFSEQKCSEVSEQTRPLVNPDNPNDSDGSSEDGL